MLRVWSEFLFERNEALVIIKIEIKNNQRFLFEFVLYLF